MRIHCTISKNSQGRKSRRTQSERSFDCGPVTYIHSDLPGRVNLDNRERNTLVKHGKKLGGKIQDIMTIVSYSAFRRWVRKMEEDSPAPRNKSAKKDMGRPKVEEDGRRLFICDLCIHCYVNGRGDVMRVHFGVCFIGIDGQVLGPPRFGLPLRPATRRLATQ